MNTRIALLGFNMLLVIYGLTSPILVNLFLPEMSAELKAYVYGQFGAAVAWGIKSLSEYQSHEIGSTADSKAKSETIANLSSTIPAALAASPPKPDPLVLTESMEVKADSVTVKET